MTRSDLQLAEQAIRNRWELDPRLWKALPAEALKILADPDASYSHKLRAISLLRAMLKDNTDSGGASVQIEVTIEQRRAEILSRLGEIGDDAGGAGCDREPAEPGQPPAGGKQPAAARRRSAGQARGVHAKATRRRARSEAAARKKSRPKKKRRK